MRQGTSGFTNVLGVLATVGSRSILQPIPRSDATPFFSDSDNLLKFSHPFRFLLQGVIVPEH